MKQLLQWVLAVAVSFAVFNAVMFLIYHPVNELTRSGGSSPGLKVYPDYGLYGFEGYAIQTIDSRGYVNPDLPLSDELYAVVGASHAEGFHTAKGRRYSDLLNERYGFTDSLKFINVSHSEYFFPDIAKRLSAMGQEFSGLKGVIIDIDSTAADKGQIEDALDQVGYEAERDSYEALYSGLSDVEKLKYKIKTLTPIIREMSLQYQTFMKSRSGVDMNVLRETEDDGESEEQKALRLAGYEESMGKLLRYISDLPFEVIIVFHPGVAITEEGDIRFAMEDTDAVFEKLCMENDIPLIDMTDTFRRAYEEEHIMPYGFMNTTAASGHMNDEAHRMIAEALYKKLSETEGDR